MTGTRSKSLHNGRRDPREDKQAAIAAPYAIGTRMRQTLPSTPLRGTAGTATLGPARS